MAINCKTPVINIAEYLPKINPTYRALLVTVTAFIIALHGFLLERKVGSNFHSSRNTLRLLVLFVFPISPGLIFIFLFY